MEEKFWTTTFWLILGLFIGALLHAAYSTERTHRDNKERLRYIISLSDSIVVDSIYSFRTSISPPGVKVRAWIFLRSDEPNSIIRFDTRPK